MARVKIVYCAECGYQPQALALVQAIMTAPATALASIQLVPWIDGTFDVSVDDELIHSMERDGGFPAHEAIIEAVRQRSV